MTKFLQMTKKTISCYSVMLFLSLAHSYSVCFSKIVQSLILIEAFVFMKRFRNKLYNANNQLFFAQSWGLFNNTGIDKG
ncbi:hypothetical protein [Helicobacter pylori]|uniref:hypothetical protein n=1 Tax=Helicobacter pylori TaxID=210 RepID=UPI003465EA1F|nr:hypothetical protein E5P64_01620 [Helicobacter pylori]